MWSPKIILHPTDFSECSKIAFNLACDLATLSQGKVVVLHANIPPVRALGEIPPPVEMELESKEEAQRLLNRMVPPQASIPVEHRMITGTAVEAILEAAKQLHADLIVMGTHGRGGLKKLMLGSVAEHVLRRAECPVLTASPEKEPKIKAK